MDVKQTAGEITSKWAAILGGTLTALSFDQVLGLLVGICGMSATWWLSVMRNRREAQRLAMAQEEHAMRMEVARRGLAIDENEGDEAV